MTFNEYQINALKFLNPDANLDNQLTLAVLGLNGEAGEVADEWKKVLYHHHSFDSEKLIYELGDILWYLALAADSIGYTLDEVAENNIKKLHKRYPEGWDENKSINRED